MPRRPSRKKPNLRRRDGALCVSFVNTASARRRRPGHYADLLLWLERHGALTSAESERFAVLAAKRPEEAEAAFVLAEELRTVLASIFEMLADRRDPPPESMAALNAHLLETLPRKCLVPASSGWRWSWEPGREDDLGRPLWPLVTSAAGVLTSKFQDRVRRCAGEGCDLLFVGRNSGSRRKWCSTKSCGKRVRYQRHYERTVKPRRQRLRALIEAESRERLRRRLESSRDESATPEESGRDA